MPLSTTHQPRMDPTSQNQEVSISVDGIGFVADEWFNTQNISGGGGVVGGTYRFKNLFSPLFVNGTIGGFGGKVNFNCEVSKKCDEQYHSWLKTEDGQKDYSFWGLQEQLTTGVEFHPPIYLFFGLDVGVRLFQGGGEFDSQREKVANKIKSVKNDDGGYGFSYTGSVWAGFHLGKKGQYGSISYELSWYTDYLNRGSSSVQIPGSLAYFHPSGFHGGFTEFGDNGFTIFAGKTFLF